MTDKEIVKALECCILEDCQGCFYGDTDRKHCKDVLIENALDLIVSQKEGLEEFKRITGLQGKRKYYDMFVKEVFQKEMGSDLVYPDFDEIYRRYFEQQEELDHFRESTKMIKAEDVVEVVRCKNCKYFKHFEGFGNWCHRRIRSDIEYRTRLNDFCSYGERKEG